MALHSPYLYTLVVRLRRSVNSITIPRTDQGERTQCTSILAELVAKSLSWH